MRLRHPKAFAALISALVLWTAQPAFALSDQWRIQEVFSSADGSVQFIEFLGEANFQQRLFSLGNFLLTDSLSLFVFPNDLPSNLTANANFLVGTVSYTTTPGAVTPDYVVPDGFFSVAGDTIRMFGPNATPPPNSIEVSIAGIVVGLFPTDGVNALVINTAAPILQFLPNTPTNFAGQTGFVNLAVPEPASLLLLGLGLAGLSLARRSRAPR